MSTKPYKTLHIMRLNRKLYEEIKKRFSFVTSENGIESIRFSNEGLNEGIDECDVLFIESVIFEGRKNTWNTAEELFSIFPQLESRLGI